MISVTLVAMLTLLELRAGDELSSARVVNIGVWIGRLLIRWAILPLLSLTLKPSLVDVGAYPYLVGLAFYVVAMDLGEYLFHRAQHCIPFLWKLHALHHSDADMNATTTERHFWGDDFIKAATIWPAATLVVHPTPVIALSYGLISSWNYVCHSRIPISFGKLSWIINSPAYHRRHHSALQEHHNSNFAALLPLWDVLFSSYRIPGRPMPPTGLGGKAPSTANILVWPIHKYKAE